MKKAILFFNKLLVVALMLASFHTQAQGIFLGGGTRTGLQPGDTIRVPLYITGNSVYSGNVLFDYDQTVLTAQASIFSQVYNPSPMGLSWTANPVYAANIYYFNFTSNTSAELPNMTNRLIGYFCFIYTGGTSGTTTVHLRRSPNPIPLCAFFNNLGGSIAIVSYTPDFSIGGATGVSGITLTSVSSPGPFDWDDPNSWVPSSGPTGVLSPAKCFNVFVSGDEVQVNGSIPGTARCNNLTIMPGGKLTNTGYSLAVAGNLLIQSDISGTGSYIDDGTTTVAGTTLVQRYMTGNWSGNWPPTTITWHYVASPVSGGTINSFTGGLLNYWNESGNTWTPLTVPLSTPLVVNKGYSAAMTSNGVISYTGGVLNTGNQTISGLTNTDASAARGFNLIGNSFPSAINWDGTITRTNVGATAYLWSGSTYATYTTSDAYVIPAEQGFFVHVNLGSTTGSMVIPNSCRTHSASGYVKSSTSEQLGLTVIGNNLEDVTSIRFNSAATQGFDDEYDAYKLWGTDACPQIFSINPDANMAINTLPEVTSQTVIAVGLKVGASDTYTVTTSGLGTFPSGTDIFLEDLFLNKVQNLNTNPEYTFTANSGSPVHRFNIHFGPLSGIATISTSNIKIYSSEKNIFVNIPTEMQGTILVYDLLGKEITLKQIEGNTLNKISMNAPQGYYLVKVLGDKATVTGKVFIH